MSEEIKRKPAVEVVYENTRPVVEARARQAPAPVFLPSPETQGNPLLEEEEERDLEHAKESHFLLGVVAGVTLVGGFIGFYFLFKWAWSPAKKDLTDLLEATY